MLKDIVYQQRLTWSSMRWCGGIMACISATLMRLVTRQGTLIVKSSSSCTVSSAQVVEQSPLESKRLTRGNLSWHAKRKMNEKWIKDVSSYLFQTGWQCCLSSSVLSCSSCSSAYVAVSAAHRIVAATSAVPVVHRHAAVQRKVEDIFYVLQWQLTLRYTLSACNPRLQIPLLLRWGGHKQGIFFRLFLGGAKISTRSIIISATTHTAINCDLKIYSKESP